VQVATLPDPGFQPSTQQVGHDRVLRLRIERGGYVGIDALLLEPRVQVRQLRLIREGNYSARSNRQVLAG
jgi:hypothetical protein